MALYSAVAVSYPQTRPTEDQRTYFEMQIDADLSSGAVEDAVGSIIVFMGTMLLEDWVIDRVVVSTWEDDNPPYNPAQVRTFSVGLLGSRDIPLGSSPAPDELTLFIRRVSSVGRTGKIMLRGALLMEDLSNLNGQFVLTAAARTALSDRLDTAFGELATAFPVMVGRSLLSTTYPATPEGTKQIPVKNYDPNEHVRTVVNMNIVGVRSRQVTQ